MAIWRLQLYLRGIYFQGKPNRVASSFWNQHNLQAVFALKESFYLHINWHTCEVPIFLGINAPSVRTTAWEESVAMEEVAKKASHQGLERRDPIQSSLLGEKST